MFTNTAEQTSTLCRKYYRTFWLNADKKFLLCLGGASNYPFLTPQTQYIHQKPCLCAWGGFDLILE